MTSSIQEIILAPYLSDPSSPEGREVVQGVYNAASTWGFFLLTNPPMTQILFRCFKYTPSNEAMEADHPKQTFGKGEYTDFGYLIILQVDSPGLQRPAPGSPPRYSFPLLFDFAWNAKMQCISLNHLPPLTGDEEKLAHKHWASTTFRQVEGTRAQDLARKVQKVFPDQNLPDFEPNSAFDEVQEGDQSIEL
ncbi:hypothetical protein BBK36DRAFT_1145363 [Trichoderma citrinoviride]|uniref:Uncharacterized protein n=1 Tax=Trichoderma citrinoviride TaxID=58853 RepID=A0A2T4AXT2_9HYPO|nr:hypothetical protein BBK36DRAFT_1145363 [Trichoderma citrinoviride]PTB61894.1 hypothetical protein BBK36DRAFT_1145363 [Trichoderma citrinoviride]